MSVPGVNWLSKAIVHKDCYTNEVPPKFEIFSDHIEIIYAGRLPIDMTKEELAGAVHRATTN